MSHLVARPGRNAAREAKRLKEIRKVKVAILWHQQEREKRQKMMKERREAKDAFLQQLNSENEKIFGARRRARKNAKEDWQLGPLRPNRAFGESMEKYGALTSEQVQKPSIPVSVQKRKNEIREHKGLALEYPLVVDDKKYFPIVKGDRVIVLKGRAKNKIGVVQEVLDQTHEVTLEGINMVCYASSLPTLPHHVTTRC